MIPAHQALNFDLNTMRLAAAREAVTRLGLLQSEAEDQIFHLLDGRFVEHPRALCTAFRKDGRQISADEKRALGIRTNAFLSTAAFNQLTDRGRGAALRAHETVLVRATFTLHRYKTIIAARGYKISWFNDEYKYDMLKLECAACKILDGTITKGDEAAIFPPNECVCETAYYGLQPSIDWLADID